MLVFQPEAGVRVEPCFFMTTEKFYIFPNTAQLLLPSLEPFLLRGILWPLTAHLCRVVLQECRKATARLRLSLPSCPNKVSACCAHCLGFNENPGYRLFLYIMYHFFFHSNVWLLYFMYRKSWKPLFRSTELCGKISTESFMWNDSCYSDFKSLRTVFFVRELCPHTQVWLLFLCNKLPRDGDTALVDRALAYCAWGSRFNF